jgi:large subunit ribosomal protein L25
MTVTLQTLPRERVGTRPSRYLRLQGRIPATLQGEGKPHVDLSVEAHQLMAARRHHEHVFELAMPDGSTDSAMVRELQWDPMGDSILHIEFRRVDLTRETEGEVELEFVGHPKGGVLNHLVTHVTVSAIPSKIPEKIEVKVDSMEIGHPLHARDLPLPEGVTLVTEGDLSVAVVVTVREEAAAAPEGEDAAGAVATPAAEPKAPGKGKEE